MKMKGFSGTCNILYAFERGLSAGICLNLFVFTCFNIYLNDFHVFLYCESCVPVGHFVGTYSCWYFFNFLYMFSTLNVIE